MSSSGIDAINSGPLILRTYTNISPYKTIVLENYDNPVPPNYVLITSTSGLIAPSNSIYISSITTSTIFSVSSIVNSLLVSTSQISTLNVSTMSTNVGWVRDLNISSINGVNYSPGVTGLWTLFPNSSTGPDMINANSGTVDINTTTGFNVTATSTLINGLTNINGNTNIICNSTLINGALNVNGSTIISNYLSTNSIQMNTGGISSNGVLSLKANDVYINSDIDGNANLHLFNNKTIISTTSIYNGCNIQLDNSGPNLNITNINRTQTYASFTSTFNTINNKLDVTAPSYISSSTHFLSIKNDYPGPIIATQSSIVSQLNMITSKGQYSWWLTDTQNPINSGGLIETNLQLYSYKYPAIAGGSKEILRIAPNGDIQIEGKLIIGTQYGGTPGNLTLSGTITTPSTISTPIIAMSTSIGGMGQITGLSSINNIQYPPPVNGEVPLGGIIMWSGTGLTLPTNWSLCDGGIYNGRITPDLRGRFIMGATYAKDTTRYTGMSTSMNTNDENGVPCPSLSTNGVGGYQNVTLTTPQMPAHRHTYTQGTGSTQFWLPADPVNPQPNFVQFTAPTSNNDTSEVGGNQSHPNMPQYYVLAYIMRTN
jgi:microcystin-dependent protein